MADCLDACLSANAYAARDYCAGVTWAADMARRVGAYGGNCWLHRAPLPTMLSAADELWAAPLCRDGDCQTYY